MLLSNISSRQSKVSTHKAKAVWTRRLTSLVFVYNSKASNHARARAWFESISSKLDITPELFDITEDGQRLNAYISQLKPSDHCLLAIGGGDGTVNAIINLLHTLPAAATKATINVLPLWGGNANDMAYMLNGLSSRSSVKALLDETKPVTIPLIRIRLTPAGSQPVIKFACCYVSFGASAMAATYLEKQRASRKLSSNKATPILIVKELSAVARGLLAAGMHTLTSSQGKHQLFEHTIINGSRIAKVDRVPVKLNEPVFFRAALERKSVSVGLRTLLKVLLKRPDGRWSAQSRLTFRLDNATDTQIDGEIVRLDAGTEVQIKTYVGRARFISGRLTEAS